MDLNKYLKYSTVIAIFTEALRIQTFIDIKPFYFIVIFNVFLLMLMKRPFKTHIINILIIAFLAVHGLLGIILVGYPINLLASQIIGTVVLSLSFYYLVRNIGFRELYETYSKVAFFVAVLGIIMFFLGITLKEEDRLHSILNEPSSFVIVILPSLYYFFKTKKYVKFSIVLLSVLLAKSSIGFIGLLLLATLPNLKLKYLKRVIIISPLLILGLWLLFQNKQFKVRFEDTKNSLNVFKTKQFESYINLSTYALLSNAYITYNNFKDYPLGTGLGSHEARHEVYVKDIETPGYIIRLGHEKLNSKDANSLFLRLVTDLGIFGLILIAYFLFLCYKAFKYQSIEALMAQSLSVYFMLKLLRQGHYFPEEFYLFLFIFLFSINTLTLKEEKDLILRE